MRSRATYIVVQQQCPEDEPKLCWVLKDRSTGKRKLLKAVGNEESSLEKTKQVLQDALGSRCNSASPMKLFTFSFQNDDQVKIQGDFYEACIAEEYNLALPEDKELESLTHSELKQAMKSFAPDSFHALKLYFQRKEDQHLKRRLLKGYSSGDLGDYKLRPKPQVVFFDCDDTLYFNDWKVANRLRQKILKRCRAMGVNDDQAVEFRNKYGTALRGLLEEGYLDHNDEPAIDRFLRDAHDIPLDDHIHEDHKLREILQGLDPSIERFVFTASVRHHAERCLQALGIQDLFAGNIIDVKDCEMETKHSPKAFEIAMRIAGVEDPESCLFFDDSPKNLETARQMGWRSILVGTAGRDSGTPISCGHAEHEIDRIHELPMVLPELFVNQSSDKQIEEFC